MITCNKCLFEACSKHSDCEDVKIKIAAVFKKIVVYQKISLCSEKDFRVLENFVVFSKILFCSRKDCCVLERVVVFQKRNSVVFCPYRPP